MLLDVILARKLYLQDIPSSQATLDLELSPNQEEANTEVRIIKYTDIE